MTPASRNYTLKDEVRDYWSDRAPTFDLSAAHRIEDHHGMPEWQALIRCAFDLGPTGSLAGLHALDIACGTGEISRVLTGLGAAVVAVDVSETMLEIARDKLAGATWQGILADAEALHPLADASVDVAVTRHLAWTLTDPVLAYAEWRRVLKPDGRLLVVDGNWVVPRGRMMRVRHRLANAIDPTGAGSDEDATRHTNILSRLPYGNGLTAEMLKRDLRNAGFERFEDMPIGRLYGAGMQRVIGRKAEAKCGPSVWNCCLLRAVPEQLVHIALSHNSSTTQMRQIECNTLLKDEKYSTSHNLDRIYPIGTKAFQNRASLTRNFVTTKWLILRGPGRAFKNKGLLPNRRRCDEPS